MRLPLPFIRLPVRFDLERLRAEVASLPAEAWAPHPNHIAGNTSLRLISVEGGDNDDVDGVMRSTPHLAKLPYVRQVLASFGAVWSRSRLLRLDPGAVVPEHADINYHWFYRVRVHIPIVTRPEVLFHCGEETVHMRGGEAWLFDNWRLHSVENPQPDCAHPPRRRYFRQRELLAVRGARPRSPAWSTASFASIRRATACRSPSRVRCGR